MRHLRRTIGVLATGIGLGLALATPSASAHDGDSHHARVAPAHPADGRTGSQLLAQAWTTFYELDTSDPQPNCLYTGRTGRVLVAGSVDEVCRVERGYPVMFFFGSTCDTISPPPFYAVTARGQRRCALKADRSFISGMHLRVDHGPDVRLTRPRFELFTGQRSVDVPVDNIFGAPAGPATFTAHAWAAFAEHLCLGRHRTVLTVDFSDGSRDVTPRTIRVVR
jgi:hypothetical protein